MPKIREYTSQVQTVGPPGGRDATAADYGGNLGAGMADAGQSLRRAAHSLQERNEQQEVSDLHAKVADAHLAATKDLQQALQSADPSDRNFAENYANRLDERLAQIADNTETAAGRNYAVRATAQLKSHFLEQAMAGQAALAGEKARSDITTSYNKYSSALIDDPSSFQMALDMNAQGIDALVQAGNLPSKDAVKLKTVLGEGLAESAVRGWIQNNPVDAKAQLHGGQWDQYLSGDKKKQLLGEADQAIRAADAEKARQKREMKEAMEVEQIKTQNSFLEKFAAGKLSTKEVLASNLDPFGSGSKETFISMIKAQAKEGTGAMKTDPGVMLDLFGKITRGEIRDENDLNPYFGKGLNIESLNQLRAEVQGRRTTEGKIEGQLKDGVIAVAKAALTKSNPMLGIKDPEGEERLQSWMNWFLPEFDKQKKAGKTATELLNPESPDYLGKNIKAYQRSPTEILRAGANSMGARTPPGTPPPPPGSKVVP